MPGQQAEKYPIGVLFVHGIGDQKSGETLVSYADPIVDFTQDWLANTRRLDRTEFQGGFCTLGSASLESSSRRPPNVELHLIAYKKQAAGDPVPVTSVWLLAECLWAKCFPPPSAAEVIAWGIPVAPWAVASHFARRIQCKPRLSFGWFVRWLQVLLFALPLMLLIEIAMTAVALLSR